MSKHEDHHQPRTGSIETSSPTHIHWREHARATRVYAAERSDVWHSDRNCPRLNAVTTVKRYPLEYVLTTVGNPSKPCTTCSYGINHCIDVATTHEGMIAEAAVYDADGELDVPTIPEILKYHGVSPDDLSTAVTRGADEVVIGHMCPLSGCDSTVNTEMGLTTHFQAKHFPLDEDDAGDTKRGWDGRPPRFVIEAMIGNTTWKRFLYDAHHRKGYTIKEISEHLPDHTGYRSTIPTSLDRYNIPRANPGKERTHIDNGSPDGASSERAEEIAEVAE